MRLSSIFGVEGKFKVLKLTFRANIYAMKQAQKERPNAQIANMIFSDQHFNQRKAVAIISSLQY